MRRLTRLTMGFAKEVENLAATVSPHFMPYNCVIVRLRSRASPAMEEGVADRV
jgi:hypothetical protein